MEILEKKVFDKYKAMTWPVTPVAKKDTPPVQESNPLPTIRKRKFNFEEEQSGETSEIGENKT